MRLLSPVICVLMFSVSAAVAQDGPPGTAGDGEAVVLNDGAVWRAFYTMRTPVTLTDGGPAEVRDKRGPVMPCRSPLPPADWTSPDFDDSAWCPWSSRRFGEDRGFGVRKTGESLEPVLHLLCLRGRFVVESPEKVRKLTLALTYRGGVVVRLNGARCAVGHLPDGEPTAETFAQEYAAEAAWNPEARLRRLEGLAIPPNLLRKGVNVLTLELHRPPHPKSFGKDVWLTCGLVGAELRAEGGGIVANLGRPSGVQVWQLSTLKDLLPWEYCDAAAAAAPIRLSAVRNGIFTAHVAVTADRPLADLEVRADDLAHQTGRANIPAAAVEVLYYHPRRGYALSGQAVLAGAAATTQPAEGAGRSVWLKVRVPADAPPGLYAGRLVVRTGSAAVEKRIELKLYDWTLPRTQDYATFVELIPSPESVALHYNVPLWSDEHFKLMEKTFALMGQAGNKVVHLPLIGHTNLGNAETIVRWIKKPDGTFDYDLGPMDRYLDLAQKYLAPRIVCLYVWDLYIGAAYRDARDPPIGQSSGRMGAQFDVVRRLGFTGPKVTLLDPAGGTVSQMIGPTCDTPEARTFWRPVFERVRANLARRGLAEAMMIGINSDLHPLAGVVDLFAELLPGMKWMQHSHEHTPWMRYPNAQMGYCAHVYPTGGSYNRKAAPALPTGWARKDLSVMYPREYFGMASHPIIHRRVAEHSMLDGWSGIGRFGMDFWPVVAGRKGAKTSISARYPESSWIQLDLHTKDFAFAGPDGPGATAPFERFREGIQDCEMRIFLEKTLLDESAKRQLGAELASRCLAVLDERRMSYAAVQEAASSLHTLVSYTWCEGDPWSRQFPDKLMSCLEAAAQALGQPSAPSRQADPRKAPDEYIEPKRRPE